MRWARDPGGRPLFFTAGSLPASRRRDAVEYVRGLIGRFCVAPEIAGYFLLREGDRFLYEIQEGGPGRAWLPEIVRALSRTDAPVRVRVGDRVAEIARGPDGELAARLLPEGEGEPTLAPKGSGRLIPYERQDGRRLVAAVSYLIAGLAAAGVAAGVLTTATRAASEAALAHPVPADHLPLTRLPERLGPREYIAAIRFEGGRWRVERRSVQPGLSRPPRRMSPSTPGGPRP